MRYDDYIDYDDKEKWHDLVPLWYNVDSFGVTDKERRAHDIDHDYGYPVPRKDIEAMVKLFAETVDHVEASKSDLYVKKNCWPNLFTRFQSQIEDAFRPYAERAITELRGEPMSDDEWRDNFYKDSDRFPVDKNFIIKRDSAGSKYYELKYAWNELGTSREEWNDRHNENDDTGYLTVTVEDKCVLTKAEERLREKARGENVAVEISLDAMDEFCEENKDFLHDAFKDSALDYVKTAPVPENKLFVKSWSSVDTDKYDGFLAEPVYDGHGKMWELHYPWSEAGMTVDDWNERHGTSWKRAYYGVRVSEDDIKRNLRNILADQGYKRDKSLFAYVDNNVDKLVEYNLDYIHDCYKDEAFEEMKKDPREEEKTKELETLLSWRPAKNYEAIPENTYEARMGLLSESDRSLVENAFENGAELFTVEPEAKGELLKFLYFGEAVTGDFKSDLGYLAQRCANIGKDTDTAMRILKASAYYDGFYKNNPGRKENGAQPPENIEKMSSRLIQKCVETYNQYVQQSGKAQHGTQIGMDDNTK